MKLQHRAGHEQKSWVPSPGVKDIKTFSHTRMLMTETRRVLRNEVLHFRPPVRLRHWLELQRKYYIRSND